MEKNVPFSRWRKRPFRASLSLQLDELDLVYRHRRGRPGDRQVGRTLRIWLNCLLFFLGCVMWVLFLPTQEAVHLSRTYQGRGGVSIPLDMPMCGSPIEVFQDMGYPTSAVPSKQVLEQLPTPEEIVLMKQGDVTYDPASNQLCTMGWVGLYTRFPQPQQEGTSTTQETQRMPTQQGSISWVQEILNGLMTSAAQGLGGFLKSVIDWATSFGFLFLTPAALTYSHPVVRNLHQWMIGVMSSAMVLVLVVGGYSAMLGQNRLIREFAPRLIVAGVAALFSLFFLEQFIELHNALCLSLQGALFTAGVGDLSLPFGIINWVTATPYEILTYVIELIVAVLLSLQMAARIALLDVMLVTAPLGLLCFALPQTVAWGRLWAQAFVATLLVQFLQLLCVGLGSALIASYGHASATPVTMLIGIATLYISFKMPGMLLSNVLRASVGSVQRDATSATKSVAETAVMLAA